MEHFSPRLMDLTDKSKIIESIGKLNWWKRVCRIVR